MTVATTTPRLVAAVIVLVVSAGGLTASASAASTGPGQCRPTRSRVAYRADTVTVYLRKRPAPRADPQQLPPWLFYACTKRRGRPLLIARGYNDPPNDPTSISLPVEFQSNRRYLAFLMQTTAGGGGYGISAYRVHTWDLRARLLVYNIFAGSGSSPNEGVTGLALGPTGATAWMIFGPHLFPGAFVPQRATTIVAASSTNPDQTMAVQLLGNVTDLSVGTDQVSWLRDGQPASAPLS